MSQYELEGLRSEIPPAAPWLPILVIHIRSQVKTNKTKSKLQILKNWQKFRFKILQKAVHPTHLLKLLDKMYKFEMDPTRTVGATERTRDAGWTDGQTEWNQYSPQQLRCAEGIIIHWPLVTWYGDIELVNNIGSGNRLLPDGTNYLNQCWLVINGILWHSLQTNFTRHQFIKSIWKIHL